MIRLSGGRSGGRPRGPGPSPRPAPPAGRRAWAHLMPGDSRRWSRPRRCRWRQLTSCGQRGRVVALLVRRVDFWVGIGRTRSAKGLASSRKGMMARSSLGPARMDEHGHDHQPAVLLDGQDEWWAGMMLAMVDSLGRSLGLGDEPGDHLGVAGRIRMPPTIVWTRCRLNWNRSRPPKLPPSAPDRPEQLGVGLVVHAQELTVCGHRVRRPAGYRW